MNTEISLFIFHPFSTAQPDTRILEGMNLEPVVAMRLNLTCQSTGFPQPSIVWKFDRTEMACTDSVSTFILGTTTVNTRVVTTRVVSGLIRSATCVLSLATAGRDHRGNFTCQASNPAGDTLKTISVFALGKRIMIGEN